MWMLKQSKIYIDFMKRERNIGICNVISRLVERKFFKKKVGDIYYGMQFVLRIELKYVLLKMCTFFHKYLLALKKSLEIWYAWLVANFICNGGLIRLN